MACRPIAAAAAVAAWLVGVGELQAAAAAPGEPSQTLVAAANATSAATPPVRGPIDVFLVAGQSNATGIPDNAIGSPTVPPGQVLQFYGGHISDANDPVGNAEPGSAWPAFGIAYVRATGHRVMFVPASMPASSMGAGADVFQKGHWDPSGKLFDIAVARTRDALRSAGPDARFCGVLWDQGEADGLSINLGFETADDYRRMLVALIARFRSVFGAETPFFIFETGANVSADQRGFVAVRSVQTQVSHDIAGVPIVFHDAVTFPARGLMARQGGHYTQAGYNEMGAAGGAAVAAFLKSNRPPIQGSQ